MAYNQQITIYIESSNSYSIYFSYNQNTIFQDLFEFIIYNNPEKNICPCYKMQYYNNSNGTYYDLSLNENVYNYINNNSYKQYNLVKKSKRDIQHENHKNFFKLPKFHIYNILNKYMKNLESQINNFRDASKYDCLYQIPSFEYNDYFDQELEEQKEFIDFLNSIFYEKGLNNLIQKFNTRIENINSKIQEYQEEINKLKKDSKILIDQINGDIDTDKIKKLSSLGIKEDIKPRLNLLRLDPKTNQFIGNETAIKKDFTNFYDIIIDIKSMKSICNGWEIKKSKRIETNYEQFNKNEVIVVGVIGNSNKGKSFILSKISKVKDIPSGSSIRTEGLSIKYPDLETYQDRKIVLLDSAGLETPVLNEELELQQQKKEEEINNKEKTEEKANKKEEKPKEEKKPKEKEKEKEEEEKEEEEIDKTENLKDEKIEEKKETLDESKNKDEIQIIDESIKETPKKDENEIFKENSRDKLITELFLQNYIINQSNILIIVVGILTYSEQKMLCKIKNEILSSNEKKPLYIIHNLMTYTTIEQVEDYISNCLLKSSTFSLKLGHKISTKTQRKSGVYYYEKIFGNEIYHLIFANEGSEAGIFYNNLTLDFIENSYQRVINIKPYDAIKTVKEQFTKMSREIIEKTEKPLTLEFDETNNNYIKLKNPKKITLKCCSINELGISNLVSNGFEPTYNLYKNDNKIILKIESGGNSTILDANLMLGQGENTCLIVTGEKKRDKEPKNLDDNIFNSRKFGKFYLNIPIKGDYIIKNETPKIFEKKGILFIEYNLDDKITGGKYELEEEI